MKPNLQNQKAEGSGTADCALDLAYGHRPNLRAAKVQPQTKRPPDGGLSVAFDPSRSDQTQSAALSPIGHKAETAEAQDHHRPGGRLGDGGGYRQNRR
jgi:hypothetical protein